jgi:hypothetical protein
MNYYENIKFIDESWSTETYDSWEKLGIFILDCLNDWEKGHPYTQKMNFAIQVLQQSLKNAEKYKISSCISSPISTNESMYDDMVKENEGNANWLTQTK